MPLFSQLLKLRTNCEDLSSIWSLIRTSKYMFHIFTFIKFIPHGYITNSQYDQLQVGLIAQLVEHCTGIAEVIGSNPVQAWIFFRLSFRNCLSCVVTARIFLLFDLSSAVQNICFIYLHLLINSVEYWFILPNQRSNPLFGYFDLEILPSPPACLKFCALL